MLACVPENFRPLSIDDRISPMPNRPITAIRKSKPTSSCSCPKVIRSVPVTLSRPTAPSAKPRHMDASTLNGEPRAHADEAGERQEEDGEELGRSELQRELGDQRRQEGDQDHRHQRADERGGEGGGQRLVGLALLGHGMAVEGGRHRPGLARDIEEDRGDGAAEQRSPIDAGEHDDGRGRRHREGERQQDRHPVGAAEARQDADDDAEQNADHHQGQVVPGERDLEAADQRGNLFHDAFNPSGRFPARQVGIDARTAVDSAVFSRVWYTMCQLQDQCNTALRDAAQVAFGRSGRASQLHNRSVRRAIALRFERLAGCASVAYGIPETTRYPTLERWLRWTWPTPS